MKQWKSSEKSYIEKMSTKMWTIIWPYLEYKSFQSNKRRFRWIEKNQANTLNELFKPFQVLQTISKSIQHATMEIFDITLINVHHWNICKNPIRNLYFITKNPEQLRFDSLKCLMLQKNYRGPLIITSNTLTEIYISGISGILQKAALFTFNTPNLKTLMITNCWIEKLMGDLRPLQDLILRRCWIGKSVDLQKICPSLITFSLSTVYQHIQISTLPTTIKNLCLERLFIDDKQNFTNLTSLTSVKINDCAWYGGKVLFSLPTNLRQLTLITLFVEDISTLRNLTQLQTLTITQCQLIQDVNVLFHLPKLETLTYAKCGNRLLTMLENVTKEKNLKFIYPIN